MASTSSIDLTAQAQRAWYMHMVEFMTCMGDAPENQALLCVSRRHRRRRDSMERLPNSQYCASSYTEVPVTRMTPVVARMPRETKLDCRRCFANASIAATSTSRSHSACRSDMPHSAVAAVRPAMLSGTVDVRAVFDGRHASGRSRERRRPSQLPSVSLPVLYAWCDCWDCRDWRGCWDCRDWWGCWD